MKITQNELNKLREKEKNTKLKKIIKNSMIYIGSTLITGMYLLTSVTNVAVNKANENFEYNNVLTSINVEDSIKGNEVVTEISDEQKLDFMHKIVFTVHVPIFESENNAVTYEILIDPAKFEDFKRETNIDVNDLIIDGNVNFDLVTDLYHKLSDIEKFGTITRSVTNGSNKEYSTSKTTVQVTTGNYEFLNIPKNETIEYLFENDMNFRLDIALNSISAMIIGLCATVAISKIIELNELINISMELPSKRKRVK